MPESNFSGDALIMFITYFGNPFHRIIYSAGCSCHHFTFARINTAQPTSTCAFIADLPPQSDRSIAAREPSR